jgi:tRNA (mo5U34)-methyltransferase
MTAEDTAPAPLRTDIAELRRRSVAFAERLDTVRQGVEPPPWGWYPFPMLPALVDYLDQLLTGDNRRLLESPPPGRVADIGGADGDFSFFLESQGWTMDLYDGGSSRISDLRLLPARRLKQALGSSVELHEIQLDRDFSLPHRYELAFFMGVLYHLRNPMLALECVARAARHCVISTKVMRTLPARPGRFGRAQRSDVGDVPVAYLYDAFEVNDNDPSNYWVFSEAGLRRTATRSGWTVLDYTLVGNPDSEPASPYEGRAFVLLRSELFDRPEMDPMQLDEARLGRLEAADAYLRQVRTTTTDADEPAS